MHPSPDGTAPRGPGPGSSEHPSGATSGASSPAHPAQVGAAPTAQPEPVDGSPGDDPHPHTGASFIRPPVETADADDYFQRLVVASHGGDAPTGMIVMPETFDPDLTGALNRTGDVMLTGSLRVSRELSSYGGFRDDLESPDLDVELVTENVRDGHRPVSARRSVSAQRETGLGLTPTHERGIKVWIGVVIGALVVAVGGAGVIVFGFVSGWF